MELYYELFEFDFINNCCVNIFFTIIEKITGFFFYFLPTSLKISTIKIIINFLGIFWSFGTYVTWAFKQVQEVYYLFINIKFILILIPLLLMRKNLKKLKLK